MFAPDILGPIVDCLIDLAGRGPILVEAPIRREVQPDRSRVRFWGRVDEYGEKVFRVVTLADETTIHNAFPDRGFKE